MDQLERAARDGLRVALVQQGNEHVIRARRIETVGSRDVLVGVVPMTGEERRFELTRVESFQVLG
jgi:uncharacterized protein with PhoU and TrkA domain